MFRIPSLWEDPYYEETFHCAVGLDLRGSERVIDALPETRTGHERVMQIRLLFSTVAAFIGDQYRYQSQPRFPMNPDGSICPIFLKFAVNNLPQGRGNMVKDLRRQLIAAAEAQEIAIPKLKAR